eukprot:215744-Pleurochrysis_carterae.AAC.1
MGGGGRWGGGIRGLVCGGCGGCALHYVCGGLRCAASRSRACLATSRTSCSLLTASGTCGNMPRCGPLTPRTRATPQRKAHRPTVALLCEREEGGACE